MPCRDEYAEQDTSREYLERLHAATRAACAAFHTLERLTILSEVIKEESGGEALQWWSDHKIEDQKRLQEEARKREANRLREAALAKLTPHEKKLLGLPIV